MSNNNQNNSGGVGQLLTCPVCFTRPRPPVYQCSNGHIICRTCIVQIERHRNQCPECRVPYGNTRIRSILADTLLGCGGPQQHLPHQADKIDGTLPLQPPDQIEQEEELNNPFSQLDESDESSSPSPRSVIDEQEAESIAAAIAAVEASEAAEAAEAAERMAEAMARNAATSTTTTTTTTPPTRSPLPSPPSTNPFAPRTSSTSLTTSFRDISSSPTQPVIDLTFPPSLSTPPIPSPTSYSPSPRSDDPTLHGIYLTLTPLPLYSSPTITTPLTPTATLPCNTYHEITATSFTNSHANSHARRGRIATRGSQTLWIPFEKLHRIPLGLYRTGNDMVQIHGTPSPDLDILDNLPPHSLCKLTELRRLPNGIVRGKLSTGGWLTLVNSQSVVTATPVECGAYEVVLNNVSVTIQSDKESEVIQTLPRGSFVAVEEVLWCELEGLIRGRIQGNGWVSLSEERNGRVWCREVKGGCYKMLREEVVSDDEEGEQESNERSMREGDVVDILNVRYLPGHLPSGNSPGRLRGRLVGGGWITLLTTPLHRHSATRLEEGVYVTLSRESVTAEAEGGGDAIRTLHTNCYVTIDKLRYLPEQNVIKGRLERGGGWVRVLDVASEHTYLEIVPTGAYKVTVDMLMGRDGRRMFRGGTFVHVVDVRFLTDQRKVVGRLPFGCVIDLIDIGRGHQRCAMPVARGVHKVLLGDNVVQESMCPMTSETVTVIPEGKFVDIVRTVVLLDHPLVRGLLSTGGWMTLEDAPSAGGAERQWGLVDPLPLGKYVTTAEEMTVKTGCSLYSSLLGISRQGEAHKIVEIRLHSDDNCIRGRLADKGWITLINLNTEERMAVYRGDATDIDGEEGRAQRILDQRRINIDVSGLTDPTPSIRIRQHPPENNNTTVANDDETQTTEHGLFFETQSTSSTPTRQSSPTRTTDEPETITLFFEPPQPPPPPTTNSTRSTPRTVGHSLYRALSSRVAGGHSRNGSGGGHSRNGSGGGHSRNGSGGSPNGTTNNNNRSPGRSGRHNRSRSQGRSSTTTSPHQSPRPSNPPTSDNNNRGRHRRPTSSSNRPRSNGSTENAPGVGNTRSAVSHALSEGLRRITGHHHHPPGTCRTQQRGGRRVAAQRPAPQASSSSSSRQPGLFFEDSLAEMLGDEEGEDQSVRLFFESESEVLTVDGCEDGGQRGRGRSGRSGGGGGGGGGNGWNETTAADNLWPFFNN